MMPKMMIFTFPDPCVPSQLPDLRELVMEALRATYRFPEETPENNLPVELHPDNIESLEVEEVDGGWASHIGFANVPDEMPNTVGFGYLDPHGSALEAFLQSAAALCKFVTGSEELPFSILGNRLMVMSYGPGQDRRW